MKRDYIRRRIVYLYYIIIFSIKRISVLKINEDWIVALAFKKYLYLYSNRNHFSVLKFIFVFVEICSIHNHIHWNFKYFYSYTNTQLLYSHHSCMNEALKEDSIFLRQWHIFVMGWS